MEALEQRADAAAAQGNFHEALRLLNDLIGSSPTLPLHLKAAAMNRALGSEEGAIAAIDRALALSPLDFTALLMRATALYNRDGAEAAGEAYARALAQAPSPAPPHLAPILAVARARHRAWQEGQRDRMRRAAGAHLDARVAAMIDAAVRLSTPDRDGPTHYCYPGLGDTTFHPREAFGWIAALEARTEQIADELAALLAARDALCDPYIRYPDSAPVAEWQELNHNRDWSAIHLIDHGRTVDENARRCPATMAALSLLPQPRIPGIGPNAMFSLLAAHTHIPPHHGIANTRLVCHLPLVVPAGCWFRVGDHRREWVRGQAWVFDDTIEHEAMNPTDHLRVVLIADIWHPALDAATREAVGAVMAAGGQIHAL